MAKVSPTIERLERELTYLARRLEANARKRRYPLDRAHYLLLLNLADGPMSISALAHTLDLDDSTVTRQVAAMEKHGHVEKRANPDDGRGAIIAATREGLDAAETMRSERRTRMATIFGGWSTSDLEQFAELLARGNRQLAESARSDLKR